MMKTVFQLDSNGAFVGEAIADESPLEPGIFLVPAGCVETPPPSFIDGKIRVFVGGAWQYQDAPNLSDENAQPAQTDEALAAEIRVKRAMLLDESDWVVIRALDTGTAVPADWAAYRQELRDVPEQPGFPRSIDWPVAP